MSARLSGKDPADLRQSVGTRTVGRRILLAIGCLGSASLVLTAQSQSQSQTPPTFVATSVLVPVDVHVVDAQGQPVTDLRQADFEAIEDGKPRPIRIFEPYAMDADPSAKGVPLGRPGASPTVAPQHRRVFLLVLGRGQLEVVSRGLTAAEAFVRERLLPQDEIAVMAWDRAIGFSTDTTEALAFLERFRMAHERIERELVDWFSGLRGVYGPKEIPPAIQADIDTVFGAAVTREVGAPVALNQRRSEADNRDTIAALQTRAQVQSLPAVGTAGRSPSIVGLTQTQEAALKASDLRTAASNAPHLDLDDFTELLTRADQDVSKLYAGIEYLRGIDGEKHLVFVTAGGVSLPRVEDEKDLAGRASDARVAIDCIQTGGITTGDLSLDDPYDSHATWAFPALERFAELTGGTTSVASYAAKGFDAIDRATRFEYLIGYEPATKSADGRFHQIQIKVRRPGVTVLARRGYFSTPRPALSEHEVMAYTRVLTTAAHPSRHDFALTASVNDVVRAGSPAIDIRVTADASRLAFERRGDTYVAPLDVAIFAKNDTASETRWFTVDLTISAASYEARRHGDATFSVTMPVPGPPRQVLAVVYEFSADMVSAAYARVR